MFRSGITLAVIAAICTALVALTYSLTAERIVANEQAWLERSLQPALSGLFYDSGVTESKIVIPPPHDLPGSEAAIIYRVYAEGAPVAALFVVSARDGYAGPIRILVGIDTMGVVTGVHVLEHRETPGLGDRVDSTKSDWVKQFNGHSLLDPEPTGWAIKGDGGQYDQLTGASVTPRAIIKAIKETLLYFEAHSEEIFAEVIPDTDKEETEQ
ncbi:MAG: electron transport complex subunit RsxG [Gammaproteobacteria bacterium]|nr:electron transport complex subunit RsxG [Gammaproteobacteria bacterium]